VTTSEYWYEESLELLETVLDTTVIEPKPVEGCRPRSVEAVRLVLHCTASTASADGTRHGYWLSAFLLSGVEVASAHGHSPQVHTDTT
jgi:hypothetical protein